MTNSEVLKTVIDNTKNHLISIDDTLRENNRRISEMLTMEKLSPNVLNLLVEIKKKNTLIMQENKHYTDIEVIVNDDEK